jgi:hypothetical protein
MLTSITLQQGGFAALERIKGHISIWSEDGTFVRRIKRAFRCGSCLFDFVAKIAEVEHGIIACQKDRKLVFYNIFTGQKVRELEIGDMMVRCFLK